MRQKYDKLRACDTFMDLSKNTVARWARRKDSRPAELLDAATELFVERGFAATRLDDVAARAGVSKGTLYLYYKNKADLLKAVVKAAYLNQVGEAKERFRTHTGSIAELIAREMTLWWKNIGESRFSGIPKLILSEAGNFPEIAKVYQDEVVKPYWSHLRQLLDLGASKGEFRVVDSEYMVRVMFAPLWHLAMWRHSLDVSSGVVTDADRYIRAHIKMVLYGLLSEQDIQRQSPEIDISSL